LLSDNACEIVAIDVDANAIEDARQRNSHGNVTFLVANMENFDLKRKFDVILSVGVGYMYLQDLPHAIKNISYHLDDAGVFLAICSSPDDEYQKIVHFLVEENVRTIAFYSKFEQLLSDYFTFEKRLVKGQLNFSDFEEISRCFQREL
jgi:SAM-dependent methyltransferase